LLAWRRVHPRAGEEVIAAIGEALADAELTGVELTGSGPAIRGRPSQLAREGRANPVRNRAWLV